MNLTLTHAIGSFRTITVQVVEKQIKMGSQEVSNPRSLTYKLVIYFQTRQLLSKQFLVDVQYKQEDSWRISSPRRPVTRNRSRRYCVLK